MAQRSVQRQPAPEDLRAGRMTIAEAKQRLTNTDRSFVEVSRDGTAPLSSVIREPQSDVSQEKLPDPFAAIPAIDRREEKTDALILTSEAAVNEYRCFLAITDRVQRDKGHFFSGWRSAVRLLPSTKP